MATPDELLDAFVAAWRAGDAPEAGAWIERADPADRDELADLIEGFLLVADDVEPTPQRRAEIEADPLVARLVAIADTGPPAETPAVVEPAFGARLRELRERAGLGLAALAERFTASFGLAGGAARAERYLGELETGGLDPRGVSSRAAFRLEELLGAAAGTLERPSSVAFRALPASSDLEEEDDVADLLRLAAEGLTLPADHEWDELDDLLRGG